MCLCYLPQFQPFSLSWSLCLFQKPKIWRSTKFGDRGETKWRTVDILTEYILETLDYDVTICEYIYRSILLGHC